MESRAVNSVCACVRACVRAYVRTCVRACVRAYVRAINDIVPQIVDYDKRVLRRQQPIRKTAHTRRDNHAEQSSK